MAEHAMTFTSHDLYRRGVATLVASWEAYAAGSEAAVAFDRDGDCGIYNAAVGFRDLGRILEYVPG